MAKEEKKVEEEAPAPKSSKKKFIIIGGLLLVLIVGGGLGGYLFLKKKNAAAEEETAVEEAVVVKKEYLPLPRFVTNLKAKTEDGTPLDKYVSLEISFEIVDDESKEDKKTFLKNYEPIIKNTLLVTIDGFDDKKLLTSQGKKEFSNAYKAALNKLYKENGGSKHKSKSKGHSDDLIEDILFTSFIIQ